MHAKSSDHSVSSVFYPQIVRHLVGRMQKGQLMCADVSFLWFFPQIVGDLNGYIRNSVLMVSPCVSTHSQYVISSGRSSKECSRCLVFSLSDAMCVISSDKFGVASPHVFSPRMCIISLFGIHLERIADNVCLWCDSQLVRNSVE